MRDAPQTGLCIVRAEVQGDYVLITITSTSSLTRTLRPAYGQSARHFVDVEKATEAVAKFLRKFTVRTGEHDTLHSGSINGDEFEARYDDA
jgi:hypothetical protein